MLQPRPPVLDVLLDFDFPGAEYVGRPFEDPNCTFWTGKSGGSLAETPEPSLALKYPYVTPVT